MHTYLNVMLEIHIVYLVFIYSENVSVNKHPVMTYVDKKQSVNENFICLRRMVLVGKQTNRVHYIHLFTINTTRFGLNSHHRGSQQNYCKLSKPYIICHITTSQIMLTGKLNPPQIEWMGKKTGGNSWIIFPGKAWINKQTKI